MGKEIDFSTYQFRCSQLSKLMTGTIGLTEKQEYDMRCLTQEKETGLNVNGNKIRWTPTKEDSLQKLKAEFNNPTMPKTMQTELRKIYRMEKYGRNFPFTNKYIQKGLQLEEEAITFYQSWRNANNIRTYFKKNEERIFGEYFQGEPDLSPVKVMEGKNKGLMCGFDIKNSYALDTLPFPEDELVDAYTYQNLGYIKLSGADMWVTASCLINHTEYAILNEKIKWDNSLRTSKDGLPAGSPDHPYYDEYIKMCKEVERMMIFDWKRYAELYPYSDLEHSKEEWFDNGYDIPAYDRIVEKATYRDDAKILDMENRCRIGRKYLADLQRQEDEKLMLI